MNRKKILLATTITVIALVAVAALSLGAWPYRHGNPAEPSLAGGPYFSLQNVSLCASNCIYPSPYLSATILVNAGAPLSALRFFINGTDEGTTTSRLIQVVPLPSFHY